MNSTCSMYQIFCLGKKGNFFEGHWLIWRNPRQNWQQALGNGRWTSVSDQDWVTRTGFPPPPPPENICSYDFKTIGIRYWATVISRDWKQTRWTYNYPSVLPWTVLHMFKKLETIKILKRPKLKHLEIKTMCVRWKHSMWY